MKFFWCVLNISKLSLKLQNHTMLSIQISKEEENKREEAVQDVIFPYLRHLLQKNGKRQKKEKWIQETRTMIETLLPNFNYLIHKYSIIMIEENVKGILVSYVLPICGILYRILIFESGIFSGRSRLTSNTDVIFGGPIKPEYFGMLPLSRFKLLIWPSKEYSEWTISFYNLDSFDRQSALLNTQNIIDKKGIIVKRCKDF